MVLIKDMDMPVDCYRCPLHIDLPAQKVGICIAANTGTHIATMREPGKRLKYCPLTAVEPYGPEGTLYKER